VWALEKDHVIPVARGGKGTVTNTRSLCRAHNRLVAEQLFGKGFLERKIEEAKSGGADSGAEYDESVGGRLSP
jgi:5-methylcytosine-specific restriction endonuclease McrA